MTGVQTCALPISQVFTVKPLADGALLAGTSPKGALYIVRDSAPVARVALPVDSIFDLLLLDADTALVATGNPGCLMQIGAGLRRSGSNASTVHPVDLLDASYAARPSAATSGSG